MKRRKFLRTVSATGLGIAGAPRLPSWLRSPAETVVVAVMGLNNRGSVLGRAFARAANATVAYVCDVDSQVLSKGVTAVAGAQTKPPKGLRDFRKALDDKDVDALVIAAPDHWHTPAALLAMRAGKHVYLEKPCGHNPREGELLVDGQRKYRRVVQMGTQQRSAPKSIELMQAIAEGIIGRPYLARAWYANTRAGIGRGQPAPVPTYLDYDLWQGPAPRTPYHDNVIHYNWHWFHRWGTGEICNNGTHEIDVARWALRVDYPTRVTSTGGRYHFQDDWEFPDTQEACFEFGGGKTIIWQGQSCNGLTTFGRGRGTAILGTEGSAVVDRDNTSGFKKGDADALVLAYTSTGRGECIAYSNDRGRTWKEFDGNPVVKHEGRDPRLLWHVLLCHLGNIAQTTGRALRTDPSSGHILDDAEAMRLWQREYEPGWTPVV